VFRGDIFDVYQWEQELFDGSKTIFEKLKRDDTVLVVPSTSDRKLILLEDSQPARKTVTTFPGGRMDKEGEDPLSAVKRELLEETGYASEEWELWKSFQPVTKIDWAFYVFIAKNCKKIAEPELDPGERITMELVTLDELIAFAKKPDFMSEELALELIEAKYDPEAKKALETKLFG
jgi:ADP-ribose pyrophosphatase